MDRKRFYDVVRADLGKLTVPQVSGFERYLDEGERRGTPLDWLAYIIATVFWETARTMQPVKEAYWKSEAWRKANLRYFPWYGRGDVQLTWEANYLKAGKAIGVDLIKNPDAALDPANAVKIAFEGMEQGWFTGKSLDTYLDGVDEADSEDLREFSNARRIINGVDKQVEIGRLALSFEKGLRAADYGKRASATADLPYDFDADDEPVAAPSPTVIAGAEPTTSVVVSDPPAPPVIVATDLPAPSTSKLDIARYSKMFGSLLGAIVGWAVTQSLLPDSIAEVLTPQAIDMLSVTVGGVIGTFLAPANAPVVKKPAT